MKKIKHLLVTLLITALLLPSTGSVSVRAASWSSGKIWDSGTNSTLKETKLVKKDFTKIITKDGTKNFFKQKYVKDRQNSWYFYSGNDTSLKSTYRGISMNSSLKEVYKQYGKVPLTKSSKAKKKYTNSRTPETERTLYKGFRNYADKGRLKQFVEYRCSYILKEKGDMTEAPLSIRFYFNDKKKVSAIVYMQGYREL